MTPPYRGTVPHKQVRRHDSPQSEDNLWRDRYFTAICTAADLVGHMVYVFGAVGTTPSVRRADPNNPGKMPAIGMIVEKPSTTSCVVMVQGTANGFTGLVFVPGKLHYVGADGYPNVVQPIAPAISQIVGMGLASNKLFLGVHLERLDPTGAPAITTEVTSEDLIGTRDGANRIFTTMSPFVHSGAHGHTIKVFHNGRRLRQGLNALDGDFTVAESGGPGSGFDTVVVLALSPLPRSRLYADYTAVVV